MQRRHALKLLAGSAACLGAGGLAGIAGPARACSLYPRAQGWDFRVLRHGSVIGAHHFTFARRGGDFVVEVAVDIAVGLLGVTLFRFTHRAEELWRDGWLHSLVSTTDDDGTPWRVEFERRDGALRGHVNDTGFEVPGSVVPASLWHRDTRQSQALLSTIDGRLKTVKGTDMGEDQVVAGGREVTAQHFRLTGELERDIWYGLACDIARVTFPARDGSLITLERQ